MAKKEKEKKEKPKKEKKPPKEKKPKEKKPPKPKKVKPPKPKKEKAPKKKKAKGAEDADGGKKGGKKKLLLLIILVLVVAAAAVAAVFTLRAIRGGGDQALEASEGEVSEGEAEGEEGEASGEPGEDAEDQTPEPTAAPDPIRITTAMTTAETLEYIRRFTPASLGLSGQSMDDYEIYASENIVLVDGYTCTELSVYSKDDSAGTNDIEGWYLLSRGSDHKLFSLDKETGQLTEIAPERQTDSS